MTVASIQIVPKLIPMFTVPYGAVDYRVAHGGRGSGKTKTMAKMLCVFVLSLAAQGMNGAALCAREFMNSLEDSTLAEIKDAIASEPDILAPWFDVGEKYVRTCNLPGRVDFVFVGLRHNIDSIKSKANVLITWIDEAENVSEMAYRKLIPTVMRFGGEIWLSYNPESPESATHMRFRKNPSQRVLIEQVNWMDNPWFDEKMNAQRVDDLENRPDIYHHVWEGEFLTLTEAQVFAGKYRVETFTVGDKWVPYYGLDFGFSRDPLACVEIFKQGQTLYWRREAVKVGLDMHLQGAFIKDRMGEQIARYDVIADNARPENISYLSKPINQTGGSFQLPRIKGADKGKGSVQDGVDFIKSHHNIIHPDCVETHKEFKLYSFKVDRNSGNVLPVLVDDHNHIIDAARYALEPVMKMNKFNWSAVS